MAKPILSQEYLKQLFDYKDGHIYWKNHKYKALNGKKAGSSSGRRFLQTKINSKRYGNHRLIFMMFHGYLPDEVDHVDLDRNNNKIENLRSANRCQNQYNTKLLKSNTSGYKNVHWYKNYQKWQVMISANKKTIFIGYFDDLELAALVAHEARDKYHKGYARHN